MYEDLRAAVELLKEYCINHECVGCPLHRVICHIGLNNPCSYSLPRFEMNVKEIESECE